MLSLGIKPGDYIVLGEDIVIQMVEIGNQVHINIDAPKSVPILRGALYEESNPPPVCIEKQRERDKTLGPKLSWASCAST